jgi:uncharacterized UPF0160 family protein
MSKLDLTYANRGLDPKTIAVHSRNFHADDVFAAMLLKLIYPKVEVVRSRDLDELDKCDIVADVGLIYDDTKLRYDHHQEGKAGKRENGIEFSGFGLIWKHWGLEVCRGDQELFDEIDKVLVQPIDAQDNGQLISSGSNFEGVREFTISSVIAGSFNYSGYSEEEAYDRFLDAVDLAEKVFVGLFENTKRTLSEKKAILEDYAKLKDRRFMIDAEHRPVLKFRDSMPELLFYVYPASNINGWMIKTAKAEGFKSRKDLPKEWAGKSGKELEEASGIEGLLLCHNDLFICGARSKEVILKALQAALEY